MTRQLASLILFSGVVGLAAACATKSFVQEQLSATETKLTQRVDLQETKLNIQETRLRETSDHAGASRQAIDAAGQRLQGLDTRVGEVGALASGAKTRADLATVATHDAEARLSQRLADRNKYRLLETRFIYFDSDQADLRKEGITELEEAAKTLRADANAILELQGFSDPRGNDRLNVELSRERVEAVVRYLVQHHNIELRQIRAVAMGKVALAAGEKATREAFAKARRVDLRLLAPWSSWEDAQAQLDHTAPAQTATVAMPAPRESARPKGSAPPAESALPATVALPGQPRPTQPTQAARLVGPAQAGAAPPIGIEPDQPARPKAERRLSEFLKSISPGDLGGKE